MSQNAYKSTLKIVIYSTLALIAISLIPLEFWPKEIKKVNILSEILVESSPSDSMNVAPEEAPVLLTNTKKEESSTNKEILKNSSSSTIDRPQPSKGETLFEDYAPNQANIESIKREIASIKEGQPYRIAFVGDSYIEGDIITEHIREHLQERFGGGGVGFVPITVPSPGYRKTIINSSSGWKTYSIVDFKQADCNKLTLSGFYYVPREGATVSYQGSSKSKFCDRFSSIKLIYLNRKQTCIKATINKSEERKYQLSPSESIQSLEIKGNIENLQLSFTNTDGFIAYGVIAHKDQKGVQVDNFSVRGSSGLTFSMLNKKTNEEFKRVLSHDLIILQFGLNVLSPNITNYNSYKKKMIEVVNHLKECNPQAKFIIMGVGDRSIKSANGSMETMCGVQPMVKVQRGIAQATGSIFWNTFEAMGGKNSMIKYATATPPLANKDYTHVNHAGGKEIAKLFLKSLDYELATLQKIERPTPSDPKL